MVRIPPLMSVILIAASGLRTIHSRAPRSISFRSNARFVLKMKPVTRDAPKIDPGEFHLTFLAGRKYLWSISKYLEHARVINLRTGKLTQRTLLKYQYPEGMESIESAIGLSNGSAIVSLAQLHIVIRIDPSIKVVNALHFKRYALAQEPLGGGRTLGARLVIDPQTYWPNHFSVLGSDSGHIFILCYGEWYAAQGGTKHPPFILVTNNRLQPEYCVVDVTKRVLLSQFKS